MDRYNRNRIYVSEDEQEKVRETRILLGGAGIGSIIAECALRFGFENIVIVDGDRVELSNLNRQNYVKSDIGKSKAECLAKRLLRINPKANISADELDAALKAVIDAKAESSEVSVLSGKIDTLNGTGSGSVSKAITDAFNDFATKVSDDGVVNSYKELIDWAAEHGGEAAQMTAAITNIENLLTGIGGEGDPATVKAAIAAAINDLNIGNYYTKTEVDTALNIMPFRVLGGGLYLLCGMLCLPE